MLYKKLSYGVIHAVEHHLWKVQRYEKESYVSVLHTRRVIGINMGGNSEHQI